MRAMWDVLSALIPPVVVAAVFCTFIYKLLRSEMAPRTSDGRPVGAAASVPGNGPSETESAQQADAAPDDAVERGSNTTESSVTDLPSGDTGSTDR